MWFLYFLQILFAEGVQAALTYNRIALTTTNVPAATACNVMHRTKKIESIVEVIEVQAKPPKVIIQ
jgi:hypothetical protein